MGRGRAKAKQVKVARQLKYSGGGTDLDRLRAELGVDSDSMAPTGIPRTRTWATATPRTTTADHAPDDETTRTGKTGRRGATATTTPRASSGSPVPRPGRDAR